MKASVIIPVYNAEHTIEKCVESMVLGEERDIEVILINDCSKDRSAEMCRRLAETYPQVIYLENEQNRGVSYTRNRGLENAHGEYILFVDGDDWVSGSYAARLLTLAQAYSQFLPVCGYTFLDYTRRSRAQYVLSDGAALDSVQIVTNLFDLEKRVLIQQLWNKAFRRDIIEQHRIRFDESLSMGEDFLFVLDYMEAAGIHRCAVLNKPLYYYIRANQTSLMSKWVEVPLESRLARYWKMAQLVCEKEVRDKEYPELKKRLKSNLIYQLAAAKGLSKQQRRKLAECYISDKSDRKKYWDAKRAQFFEKSIARAKRIAGIPQRGWAKIKREHIYPRCIIHRRRKLEASNVTLICQNCIGGVFYHEMGLKFLSPTINLFIREPDFMRFVSNLDAYLEQELRMQWEEEYPVGFLGDVRIDFMHYSTCREAKEAWERRKKRMVKDRIVVIATDRNGFDDACFEQWKKLLYRKILYTANPAYASEPGTVVFEEYAGQACVGNIIDHKQFYKDDVIFDVINSKDRA